MNRFHLASLISIFAIVGTTLLAQAPRSQAPRDRVAQSIGLPSNDRIMPQLYATGFEIADGPTFDTEGNLFVANYRGNGNIGRITSDGTASVFCDLRKLAPAEGRTPRAAGIKVADGDRLIVADSGAGRLLRISADGQQVEVLADRFEGTRFGPVGNVALDLIGNIYFTDPGPRSVKKPSIKKPMVKKPTGFVYRFNAASQKVERLASDLAGPTGLAVTPDGKLLCVAEGGLGRVLSFRIGDQGLGDGRLLINFSKQDTGEIKGGSFTPRGMVFDAKGRLYVAMGKAGVINVVDLEKGTLIRQYKAGGERVTNCHFDDRFLYTTIAAKEAVFRLELGVEGHSYNGPR